MELTPKQQLFVDYYCSQESETFGNATKSYEKAYSSAKMTPRGIAQNASRLISKDKIIAEIKRKQDRTEIKQAYSQETVRQRIDQTWAMAVAKGDVMACIASARLQAQEQAMLTDNVHSRVEQAPDPLTDEEKAILNRQLLALDKASNGPDTAQALLKDRTG